MENQQERQTALKVWINNLIMGQYVVKDGWEPNYVLSNNQKISRVNIIGVIVGKADDTINYDFVVIDDGSGRITIRSFENKSYFLDYSVGEIINIIGRPREYGREIYIIPEIVKKITNHKWVELRKLELQKTPVSVVLEEKQEEQPKEEIEIEKIFDSPAEKLMSVIKKLDKGEGVDIEEIIKEFNEEKIEELIKTLLLQGDIFEIRPGRIKILE